MGYLAFSAYEEESELSVAILLNLTEAPIYNIGKELTELAYNYLATEVETQYEVSNKYNISQNYPNPFNPSTKISFTLPEAGNVSLRVFNSIGEQVAVLVNKELNAGRHEVDFDAEDLTSGIYLYKIAAGNFSETKKMTLIK